MKVIFLDRDGTLIAEPEDEQVDSLEKLELIPGVIQGLQRLVTRGYTLVLVTNQDYLGTERYPLAAYERVQGKLIRLLRGEGIEFAAVFVCPHGPSDGCRCRKPNTGLLDEFMRGHALDNDHSWVIGDRETDVQLARNLGVRSARLLTAGDSAAECVAPTFLSICDAILRSERRSRVERTTNETKISIDVALDGSGAGSIATGIGFFDHMLQQIAKHGGMDLSVNVRGDLHVDEHHTVEDTGLALGEAIRNALGDKRGIGRYGFVLPMDESLARVALDLGGRPFCAVDARFTRDRIGDFPTELAEDFFRALADGLRANLHIQAEGRNDHHKIEAMFKATARALRQAVVVDERATGVPSTKGSL